MDEQRVVFLPGSPIAPGSPSYLCIPHRRNANEKWITIIVGLFYFIFLAKPVQSRSLLVLAYWRSTVLKAWPLNFRAHYKFGLRLQSGYYIPKFFEGHACLSGITAALTHFYGVYAWEEKHVGADWFGEEKVTYALISILFHYVTFPLATSFYTFMSLWQS